LPKWHSDELLGNGVIEYKLAGGTGGIVLIGYFIFLPLLVFDDVDSAVHADD
jgi:hypothetical protein